MGETIIHQDADETVQIGVWEADVSKTRLIDYPFTENTLMISGRFVIIDDDGTSNEFVAGDSFVMSKGWTGVWDIRERMKKQHIKIGDPNAKPTAEHVKDWGRSPLATAACIPRAWSHEFFPLRR